MRKIYNLLFIMVAMMATCTITSCSDDPEVRDDAYYKKIMEDGEKFLAENAKREGVVTTSTGLQYEVLVEGNGTRPTVNSTIQCKYTGRLINGKIFDTTENSGPIEFRVKEVIAGWREGLQLMTPGSIYKFYIPYYLAYGNYNVGPIPAYSALIFDVELIKVKD